MSTLVLIDGNNKMWASYHAYRSLTYRGKSTSSIYGMTTMVRAYANKFKAEAVKVVWDGRKSKHRLAVLPTYKGDRKSKDLIDFEDWKRQKVVVQQILNKLGVGQYQAPEHEADDLIYHLVQENIDKYHQIVIVSSDKDFNQLVNKKVNIWVDKQKLKTLINPSNMEEHYGYKTTEALDYLILDGDTSDNIPGYPGMGPVKIRKFLDEVGSIKAFLKSDAIYMETKKRELDKKALKETYIRNRKLIDIKYHNHKFPITTTVPVIGKSFNPQPDIAAFRKQIAIYNLTSIMGRTWIQPFLNQKHVKR
jgi:DNA polymerase-1